MRLPFVLLLLGIAALCSSQLESSSIIEGHVIPAQSCGRTSGSASRNVGYYQSWNPYRLACNTVRPSQLSVAGFTHIVMAGLTIDPETFTVQPMYPHDPALFEEFLALPDTTSKWIGIGGRELSDPGLTRYTWSTMSSSKENRKAFIDSVKQFLSKYKFRGVDIDWEWPGTADRGGNPADKRNQVDLLTEMRLALGGDIGISLVVPLQTEYVQLMDIKGLEAQVDWLTVRGFDLHGPWDSSETGLRAHADLNEIDGLLQSFWTNTINPKKLNLGLSNYARGYTVANKECQYWGCPFIGPSRPAWCTKQAGLLSECEIIRVVNEGLAFAWRIIEGGAQTNWMAWDDQWVNFDDAYTRHLKTELANDHCMGGISLWAMDYAYCSSGNGTPQPGPGPSVTPSPPISAPVPSVAQSSTASAPPSFGSTALSSGEWPTSAALSAAPSSTRSIEQGSFQSTLNGAPASSMIPFNSTSEPVLTLTSSSRSQISSVLQSPPVSSAQGSSHLPNDPSHAPPVVSSVQRSSQADPSNPGISFGQSSTTSASSGQGISSSQTLAPGIWSSSGAPVISLSQILSSHPISVIDSTSVLSMSGPSSMAPPQASSSNQAAPSDQSTSILVPVPSPNSSSVSKSTPSDASSSAQAVPSSQLTSITAPVPTPSSSGPPLTPPLDASSSQPLPSNWHSSIAVSSQIPSDSSPSTLPPSDASSSAQIVPSNQSSTIVAPVPTPSSSSQTTTSFPGTMSSQSIFTSQSTSSGLPTSVQGSSVPTDSASVTPSSAWQSSGSLASTPQASSNAQWSSVVGSSMTTPFVSSSDFPASSTPAQSLPMSNSMSAPWSGSTSVTSSGSSLAISGSTQPSSIQLPSSSELLITSAISDSIVVTTTPTLTMSDSSISTVPAPSQTTQTQTPIVSGTTTTSSAPPAAITPYCPPDCLGEDWCKARCEENGSDLDIDPPSQCWDHWWCWGWWGFKIPKPKCKLLGCGCGWMGLPWGPGGSCQGEHIKFPTNIIIDSFGLFPDPCKFFGCNGECGVFGCDGFCLGKEGCTPCPPLLCPNGGPRPGPPPKPPKPPIPSGHSKPTKCDPAQYITATERLVYCGDFKFLSSTLSMTTVWSSASTLLSTSTSSTTMCHTAVDLTFSGCNVIGHESTITTSVTISNTLSSDSPACTRAPLSLDDDEGPNDPPDWLSSSITFASNSTMAESTSFFSSSTATSSSAPASTSESPPPAGPMDRFGKWIINCNLWMENDYSKFEWVLFDPNGNEAGRDSMFPVQGKGDYKRYVESKFRIEQHSMPFGIDAWFIKPTEIDQARLQFRINKEMAKCPIASTGGCYPSFATENKIETQMFEVQSCYEHCKDSKDAKLMPSDMDCQDMNDADWHYTGKGWEREFKCWFKGF